MLLKKLEQLGNKELIDSLIEMNRREKRYQAYLVAHLSEVARRQLHLELGYKSLFAYCVEELGLDEGQVYLRTQVAGVCRRFPQVLIALAKGKISLSGAGRIAAHLSEDNCDDLLTRCYGKKREDIDRIVAGLKPRPTYRGNIRSATQRLPLPPEASDEATLSPVADEPRTELRPATPDRFNIKFSAGSEFKDLLERFAEVEGVDDVAGNLEGLLKKALEHGLERKDPKRKEARRVKRQQQKLNKSPKVMTSEEPKPCVRRRVPARVRSAVFKRSGYRCEYHSSSGRRCTQTKHLEVDHIRPWAMNGGHDLENLQILCSAHNKWKATRDFPHVPRKDSA